jgi:precorrin-2 dehydrogenase/sirohydrochlorin ferrochelatase
MTVARYCLCLSLDGETCAIVGGGAVAARKAKELLACGARLTVISPELVESLRLEAARGRLAWRPRRARRRDLRGLRLAVAATNNRVVNQAVARWAKLEGVPVNVADDPTGGDFTVPAIVRRGALTIAVATEGASPALASRLRRQVAEQFGPEWGDIIAVVQQFRADVRRRLPDLPSKRRELMVWASQLDLCHLFAQGGTEGLTVHLRAHLEEQLRQEEVS